MTTDNFTTPNLNTPPQNESLTAQDVLREDQVLSNQENVANKSGQVGYLELLEERPVVNKERLDVGKVTVTKHTRTKTIEVPIELVEEYITVRTEFQDAESQDLLSGNYDEKDVLRHVEPSLDSKAVITINDKQVEIGDTPVEIVLSRQVATVTKETYAVQEIDISKTVHTHTDTIQVALKHEELDVKEEGFLDHDNDSTYNK
ncbi:YsnF/AvaK domain-containing protein [Psychrobacter alimentarius]|uniref:YsnF/AvaK domain-containing protein n=1 Tax=Psychrobacter alimentarius TaxID=261164 RepID=UPI003FD59CC8